MIAVRSLVVGLFLIAAGIHTALAANDPTDASSSVERALEAARIAHVPLVIVFGADWCEGCRELDSALKKSANAQRLAREFRLVKVDVGNFDRNRLIDLTYGNPTQFGLPAAVVVSPDNTILYTASAGQLAMASRNEGGLYELFKSVFLPE